MEQRAGAGITRRQEKENTYISTHTPHLTIAVAKKVDKSAFFASSINRS
jgi:hypothetical protein